MNAPSARPVPLPARQRLLDAAARVFARSGLEGATTREIAREAAVNEVTLFRHFKTKDNLLSEVVRRTFDQQEAALAAPAASTATGTGDARAGRSVDPLRASLLDFARRYRELLEGNLPMVRTLIGEIHRYREHEMRVFKGIFLPLKAEILAALGAAHADGRMRSDVDPRIAADAFSSIVFAEVLRRASPYCPDYPAPRYLETCVDIFVRGVEATPRRPARTRPPADGKRPA